jgi:RNA polymerase sigma factor (sigma-70 family)
MINDDKVIDPKEAVESYEQPDTGLGDIVLTQRRQRVFSLLPDALSPAQSEVFKMRANGSKGREIADRLGMPENTVHSHLKRGIATLRNLATRQFPELCGDTASSDVFLNAM